MPSVTYAPPTYDNVSYEPYMFPVSPRAYDASRGAKTSDCRSYMNSSHRDEARRVHFDTPSKRKKTKAKCAWRREEDEKKKLEHRKKRSKLSKHHCSLSSSSKERDPYRHQPRQPPPPQLPSCLRPSPSLLSSSSTYYYPPNTRPLPPPPPPEITNNLPSQPTIYIITYSSTLLPTLSSFNTLLATQIPLRNPPIRHLYTINASTIAPPSSALCARYSGISPVLQAAVMRNPAARVAVHCAVVELLECGKKGEREVAMSVCCAAGTHRSVAIAEKIAQEVKKEVGRLGARDGVTVIVRHVHRVKGIGDPF